MMRQILTSVLKLYWTVAFAIMAVVCVFDLEQGIAKVFRLLALTDVGAASTSGSGLVVTGLFGSAFALVALLFLWAFVAGLSDNGTAGEPDEITRMAFGFGGGVLAAASILAAAMSVSGVFSAIGIQLAAMLASYLAMRIEYGGDTVSSTVVNVERSPSRTRSMATNAARNYSVGRQSGHGTTGEGR